MANSESPVAESFEDCADAYVAGWNSAMDTIEEYAKERWLDNRRIHADVILDLSNYVRQVKCVVNPAN